jgi:hypothetical protein
MVAKRRRLAFAAFDLRAFDAFDRIVADRVPLAASTANPLSRLAAALIELRIGIPRHVMSTGSQGLDGDPMRPPECITNHRPILTVDRQCGERGVEMKSGEHSAVIEVPEAQGAIESSRQRPPVVGQYRNRLDLALSRRVASRPADSARRLSASPQPPLNPHAPRNSAIRRPAGSRSDATAAVYQERRAAPRR